MSVKIIAEIGINHNGNMTTVKKLIDVAKDAGCNAVKFQKRTIDKVYSKEILDSPRESPWLKHNRSAEEKNVRQQNTARKEEKKKKRSAKKKRVRGNCTQRREEEKQTNRKQINAHTDIQHTIDQQI